MKALTVQQPWAWAIIHSGKRIENRPWRPLTAIGQRIAIHAGKTIDRTAWNAAVNARRDRDGDDAVLPRGVIIGTVYVADFHHVESCSCRCSPWAMPNAWHWILTRPTALPTPIPAAGKLGLWTLPDDVAALMAGRSRS